LSGGCPVGCTLTSSLCDSTLGYWRKTVLSVCLVDGLLQTHPVTLQVVKKGGTVGGDGSAAAVNGEEVAIARYPLSLSPPPPPPILCSAYVCSVLNPVCVAVWQWLVLLPCQGVVQGHRYCRHDHRIIFVVCTGPGAWASEWIGMRAA
jgi:hypothetical protein